MTTKKVANFLMIDDDRDDIYSTMRRMSESSLVNTFLYETAPEKLIGKLESLESANSNIIPQEAGCSDLVILLDINMPRVDGFDVLRLLKSNDKYKNIPVIMLCSSDDIVDMLDSFDLGADGYLVKPVDPLEMLSAVNQLSSHKLQLVC